MELKGFYVAVGIDDGEYLRSKEDCLRSIRAYQTYNEALTACLESVEDFCDNWVENKEKRNAMLAELRVKGYCSDGVWGFRVGSLGGTIDYSRPQ